MTAEDILIEAKHEEIIANAKFEAFEKVMQQTKRLMESCQRKGKEFQAEVERHKQPHFSKETKAKLEEMEVKLEKESIEL